MKGRLLCGLLVIATIVLGMYYKLTLLNPALVSGFIVLATGIIYHVINSAEDILVALFKVGDVPTPQDNKSDSQPIAEAPQKASPKASGSPVIAASAFAILLCSLLISSPSWAKSGKTTVNNTYIATTINPTAIVLTEPNLFGVMADAPKLVHVYGDWYLGAEGGHVEDYTSTSRGWFAYGKVTYEGTLIDIFKNKKVSSDD